MIKFIRYVFQQYFRQYAMCIPKKIFIIHKVSYKNSFMYFIFYKIYSRFASGIILCLSEATCCGIDMKWLLRVNFHTYILHMKLCRVFKSFTRQKQPYFKTIIFGLILLLSFPELNYTNFLSSN